MIDGVADQMHEWVAHDLDHFAVDFDVAALDLDHHLLAEFVRQVADHARTAREQRLDPLHTDAGDRLAQVGENGGEAVERRFQPRFALLLGDPAGEVVARHGHIRHAAHHPVEQIHGQADGARGGGLAPLYGRGDSGGSGGAFLTCAAERGDQRSVICLGLLAPIADRIDDLGDTIDHRQNCADQRLVCLAAPGAHVGERVLGGVAQRFEAREFEEAAVALDGVDEAKNRVEPRTIGRISFPRHDLARQCLEHVARFGNELGQQVIHRASAPPRGVVMRREG